MKAIFVTTLLTTAFSVVSNVFAAPDPNFHIYLSFGQSNMEGNGPIENQDKTVDKRFQVLSTVDGCNGRKLGQWYDAVPPLANCNGKLGVTDYFGRTLVKKLPEQIKVGAVVVAVAGSDIQLWEKNNYQSYNPASWMKTIINWYGGNPYGRLVDMAKIAQEVGVIKGILLHQGETNSGQQNWPTRVKAIYENLLKDLGLNASDVPLLAGELVGTAEGGACGGMNSIIDTLPNVIPTAHVISSKGLPHQGDGLHFTSASYRTFGERYAEEMLKHINTSVVDNNTANAQSNSTPEANQANSVQNTEQNQNQPANQSNTEQNSAQNQTPNSGYNNNDNNNGNNNGNNGGNNNNNNSGNNNDNNSGNNNGNNNGYNNGNNGGNNNGNNSGNNGGNGNCVGIWAQCGGIGYNGPKCCSEGVCQFINDYYSQCKM